MTNMITDEQKALAVQAEALAVQYSTIKIASNDDYLNAAEILKEINARFKQLDETRKEATRPLDAAKKTIMDWFRRPLAKLEQADACIRIAMGEFRNEEERKRAEQERIQRELAEKEAARLKKLAENNIAKGNMEKAEEQLQKAADTVAMTPVVASTIEKVQGIGTKKVWKYTIVNEEAIPRNFLMPNEKKIGEFVRATKGEIKIEGINIFCEEVTTVKLS